MTSPAEIEAVISGGNCQILLGASTGIYAGRGTIFHFDDACFLNILIILLTSRLERHRRLPPFPLCLSLMKPSPAAHTTLTAFRTAHAARVIPAHASQCTSRQRPRDQLGPICLPPNSVVLMPQKRNTEEIRKSRSRQPGLQNSLLHPLIT